MASGPITAWQMEEEKVEVETDILFLVSKITADGDCTQEIKWVLLCRKVMTNLDSVLKSRDINLPTKVIQSRLWSSPGVTYGCERWTIKKAELIPLNCGTFKLVLEKTPESPLDSKEIKPVNLQVDQPWIFTWITDAKAAAAAAKLLQLCLTLCDLIDGSPPGSPVPGILQARTLEWVAIAFSDAKAEAPVFWSSDVNRWLIGKVPDTGKDWGQKEKEASEDEIVGQHHWCN